MNRGLLQFVANAIIAWVLLRVLSPQHLPYLYPVAAIQLALLWPDWANLRARLAHLGIVATTLFAGGVLGGIPLAQNIAFVTICILELTATAFFLFARVKSFDDLKQQKPLLRFAAVTVAVSVVAAGLLSLFTYSQVETSALQRWLILALAHTAGMATITPGLLLLRSLDTRRLRGQIFDSAGVIALLLCVLVTSYVFSQTSFPWLFLIFPPLVMVLLSAGTRGAAVICPVVAFIACWGTAHRLGPVWITHGTNIETRTIVLQAFLLTIVVTALSVGAMLDQRQAAEREARVGQSIYLKLLAGAEDMILLSSLNGTDRYVSPGVKRITGFDPEEFLAISPFETIHEDDREAGKGVRESLIQGKQEHNFRYRIRCKDESYRWVEAFVRSYSDSERGEITGYVATIRDISELTTIEQAWTTERSKLARENMQLAELAGSDELTGLANRRTFNRMLNQEVARHKRALNSLSLLMIDIDCFKLYNDHYGHPEGDSCLRQVSTAFHTNRASDFTARIGGEEFAVILPDTDQAGALLVAKNILEQVRSLHLEHVCSPSGLVTVSIGIATWQPGFDADGASLIQSADVALYESKRGGRNRATATQLQPHNYMQNLPIDAGVNA